MRNSRSNHGKLRSLAERRKAHMPAIAREIAQEAFKDACNRLAMAAAVWTPKRGINHTVELYLAAMRDQLEWHAQSWSRQLKA
jgi:hypothetical protein